MQCHVIISDTSTENNFSVQLVYDSTDSTLQCKFQGYVYEVVWLFFKVYVLFDPMAYFLRTYVREFQLRLGNQYHQSTIKSTDLENYYVNKLTIVNGSAPFGPYGCAATTGSNYYSSAGISTCKLNKIGNYELNII